MIKVFAEFVTTIRDYILYSILYDVIGYVSLNINDS